jgi:hypothetical protein
MLMLIMNIQVKGLSVILFFTSFSLAEQSLLRQTYATCSILV